MNIQSMFEMQRKYNNNLIVNAELELYKVQARKNLEFEIRLGDLANETKCFNYLLKHYEKIDLQTIFNKYMNCISQLLTLGIDNNYTDLIAVGMSPNDYCLSDQFLNLYFDINDLIISPSMDHYLTLFEDLLSLGLTLGFSESQIENYFKKELYEKAVL